MDGSGICLVIGDLTQNCLSSREVDECQADNGGNPSGLTDGTDDILVFAGQC